MSFNQKEEVIIESIFKICIAIFGSPKSFLVDNGGEFNNSEFIKYKYQKSTKNQLCSCTMKDISIILIST